MKRYVCTVAAGLLLALVGTGTASASVGLPLPGQSGVQETLFGDQSVGEQKNDAEVTQEQGNGNVNIAPAFSVFGDAETENAQGNGNTAKSEVEQENDVDQDQSSAQYQSLDEGDSKDGCCDGQSQTGEQTTYGGDQSVEKQKNDAVVNQSQGNGNVNVAPAFSVFGDAETENKQGNGNYAKSDVEQENDVDQSQSSAQKQELDSKGAACCERGQSQAGEQKLIFGDQTVGEQKNDAVVNQSQGNDNASYAPARTSKGNEATCSNECGKSQYPSHGQRGGDARTKNAQGNGNVAKSDVAQKNDVDQTQSSRQKQELDRKGGDCCKPKHDDSRCDRGKNHERSYDCNGDKPSYEDDRTCDENHSYRKCDQKPTEDCKGPKLGHERSSSYDRPHDCEWKPEYCKPCYGDRQAGEQKVIFGDQTVGKQENYAGVIQSQGNENVSEAEARVGDGQFSHALGDAQTKNAQGNGNFAWSEVDQQNSVDQTQTADLQQVLVEGPLG